VTPIFQRMRLRARLFVAMVACLFLAQSTIAAAHLATPEGVVFGAVCAPQDGARNPANGGETPLIPHKRDCQGFCCILHDGALAPPPSRPVVALAVAFPSEANSSLLKTSGEAPRIEPRRAPQSPRAPPQQG